MGCSDTQELFLVEFLIDRVNIPSVQAMQDDYLNVKTCIEFKILNLPPIFISQDISSDKCTCLGEDAQIFRKGKSCLFALPSKLLKPPLCSFPIVMSVYKKLPPSVLPDVMTIGTCQIETRDMVNSLLEDCSPNPCATLKNNFRIATATGQCCGEVTLFLRFSKLGKKVVTQFQNPSNNKPYLFKGVAQSPVFQCKQVPTICEDPFSNCVCKKPSNECKNEEKPKSCCQVEQPKTGCCKESTPKPKKKGKRPCCSSSSNNEKRGGCQTKSRGATSCESKHEMSEVKQRQCGCDVKEEKPYSCAN